MKNRLSRRTGLLAVTVIGLSIPLLSWTQEPNRAQNIVSQLKQLNTKMRTDVTRLLNAEARSRGYAIQQSGLTISSLDDNLIVVGAPMQGVKAMAKQGDRVAEEGGAGRDIIGVMVSVGKGQNVSNAGMGKGDMKRDLGGTATGTFLVVGQVGPNMKSVKLVGQNKQVLAEVQLDENWRSASQDQWWKAIYMSILNKLAPMASN